MININNIFQLIFGNLILSCLIILLFGRRGVGLQLLGGGNWPLIKPYQSISVVILTFIILYGKQYEDNLILTNKLMVWLGDISYVIYLVHYPIITFIKYFFKINEFSFKSMKY
uniref:Acyltransferase 3 domain-containing protein n=1 Tax=Meloidogyne incognita TaxID=6306 RepID=A0A914LJG2_MELIC